MKTIGWRVRNAPENIQTLTDAQEREETDQGKSALRVEASSARAFVAVMGGQA